MVSPENPLSVLEIKMIYDNFGKDLIALNLHKDLGGVDDDVASIRIRLCRQRIVDCSLTAYRTIKRAMEAVSSFPWENVMDTFPSQKAAYTELIGKLKADNYYGFTDESSKYGSALVGDLYHIARKL